MRDRTDPSPTHPAQRAGHRRRERIALLDRGGKVIGIVNGGNTTVLKDIEDAVTQVSACRVLH